MRLAQYLIQARHAEEMMRAHVDQMLAAGWVEIMPGEFISPELAEENGNEESESETT